MTPDGVVEPLQPEEDLVGFEAKLPVVALGRRRREVNPIWPSLFASQLNRNAVIPD
jgi:hypothetical protein